MNWLSPAQALTLWVAVAALALVGFLLRRRAVRVVVPSLEPWLGQVPRRANPLWRELLALALQLAAAAAVCAALLPPEGGAAPPEEVPWVAVVDLSASMAQTGRLEAAAEVVRRSGAGLVLAGAEPQWAAAPGDTEQATQALATAQAGRARADLDAAVALVLEAGFRPLVLSDRPGPAPKGGRWEVVGGGGPDLAVLSVRVQQGTGLPPERAVTVTLGSTDPAPREVTARLTGGNGPLGEERLSLAGSSRTTRTWRLPPGAPGWLAVELLDAQDSLPANDRAWTAAEPLHDARVALVGPANRYLEQGLALLPGLTLVRAACGAWADPGVDLVIFDRCAGAPTRAAALWVDPPEGAGPFPPERRVPEPTFTGWDRGHPLLRGVALRELSVGEASVLRTPPRAEVLARVDGGAVFVASSAAPRRAALGFDLTRSDLPLTIAFPQLLYQLLLWARAGELEPPAVALGLGERLELEPGAALERLDAPGEVLAPPEGATLAAPAGAWRAGDVGLAVGWPAEELGSLVSGNPWPEGPPGDPAQDPSDKVTWLALAAALLLLVEFGVAPR